MSKRRSNKSVKRMVGDVFGVYFFVIPKVMICGKVTNQSKCQPVCFDRSGNWNHFTPSVISLTASELKGE